MARLTAPNGSTVNVSDEKAKRLVASGGYKPVEEKATKSTSRKASSSEKSEK